GDQGGRGGAGTAVVVAVEDHRVPEEERRGGGPPAVRAGEPAETLLPDRLALRRVAGHPGTPEGGVDLPAVGDAGGRGIPVAVVRPLLGHPLGGGLLPEQLAVAGAVAEDEAGAAPVGGSGQEDPVAPDDGGRVTGAGEADLPGEVFL